jgi:hypothetical protein
VITLKVRIRKPSSMLLANLLGVAALLGVATAIGGLTHNAWWSVLVGSLEGLVLAVAWTLRIDVEEEDEESAGTALTRVA